MPKSNLSHLPLSTRDHEDTTATGQHRDAGLSSGPGGAVCGESSDSMEFEVRSFCFVVVTDGADPGPQLPVHGPSGRSSGVKVSKLQLVSKLLLYSLSSPSASLRIPLGLFTRDFEDVTRGAEEHHDSSKTDATRSSTKISRQTLPLSSPSASLRIPLALFTPVFEDGTRGTEEHHDYQKTDADPLLDEDWQADTVCIYTRPVASPAAGDGERARSPRLRFGRDSEDEQSKTRMEDADADAARQQRLTLQRARKKAAEELEARRLIEAAGTGPRQAKQKALADPQSPAGDNVNTGTGRKKQKKRQDEIADSDAETGRVAVPATGGKSGKAVRSTENPVVPSARSAAARQPQVKRKDLVPDSSGEEEVEEGQVVASPLRKQVPKPPIKAATRKQQDEESTDGSFHVDDEDEEVQSEEEPDYSTMSEAELVPAFPREPITDARTLFDIDEADIEMSSARSSRSRRSLSVSLPPTSESDGAVLDEIDEEEDVLPPARPPKASKKPNKPTTKREAKFRNERPSFLSDEEHEASKPAKRIHNRKTPSQLRSASTHCSSEDEDDNDEDQNRWPVHAQVRGTGLLQQNVHIRAICRDAIKIAETTLVTDHAWPELNRMAEYRREVLRKAARTLKKKDDRYGDIHDRLKSDESFTKILGKWVLDRLPHARGPVKAGGINHIAIFQLGIGEACQLRVKALFEDHTYVYPGHWVDDGDGKPMWVVKSKDIYLNPALVSVLKEAFFDTPSAFGYKFKEYYMSSHPNPELSEKELTVPLVALAATGLYAGLYVWREGVRDAKAIKFEGDTYSSVFDLHKMYLLDLKGKSISKFHAVMSELYAKVTNEPKSNNATRKSGNPLSVMDLSGY
ncbi:hypothetical protein NLJ89_g8788 [Agrocybe chaxingu]|uniref:DUF6532 domain-containing protein n=1 Tax=Agrocybe chaxingu TaxID=84603 RepID=A0A9W8JU82_9AGAR|nr:hypothetical protein NLJ89_g8788 [Agrocybe chaxingu]